MDPYPQHVEKRPDFGPHQVRELAEVVPGADFVGVDRTGKLDLIKIHTEPYKKGKSTWVMVARWGIELELSLADYSVVPYPNGLWSAENHLLRLG